METSPKKQKLLEALDKMKNLHALVIGDVILDRYIWGDTDRISPEAPVPVVSETVREDRLGGAANVVRNLRAVGVNVDLCGFVGDDGEGKIVFNLLKSENVAIDGLLVDRSRPTSIKTRVIARNQQMMRIDREVKGQHSPALCEGFAALVEASIKKADFIIISDYAKGVMSNTLIEKLEILQKKGELGLSSKPIFLDPHPDNYPLYKTVGVAKPNRKEAEKAANMKITNQEEAFIAAKKLIDLWHAEMVVITLGEDGMIILKKGEKAPIFLETVARDVFDVSGAGDTVTAILAAALTAGTDLSTAGNLANIAAGVVVSEVGTVPVDAVKLIAKIEDLE